MVFQAAVTAGSFAIIIGLHGHARQKMLERVGSQRWEFRAMLQNRGLRSYRRGYQLMATSILILLAAAAINFTSKEPLLDMGPGLAAALVVGFLAAIGACELRFPDDRFVGGENGIAILNRSYLWEDVSLNPSESSRQSRWTLSTVDDSLCLDIDQESGRAMARLQQSARKSSARHRALARGQSKEVESFENEKHPNTEASG